MAASGTKTTVEIMVYGDQQLRLLENLNESNVPIFDYTFCFGTTNYHLNFSTFNSIDRNVQPPLINLYCPDYISDENFNDIVSDMKPMQDLKKTSAPNTLLLIVPRDRNTKTLALENIPMITTFLMNESYKDKLTNFDAEVDAFLSALSNYADKQATKDEAKPVSTFFKPAKIAGIKRKADVLENNEKNCDAKTCSVL